jgi:hypothetical protein
MQAYFAPLQVCFVPLQVCFTILQVCFVPLQVCFVPLWVYIELNQLNFNRIWVCIALHSTFNIIRALSKFIFFMLLHPQ